MLRVLQTILLSILAFGASATSPKCKTSPNDVTWPSSEEWTALNTSIQGNLIRTSPSASSCYPDNPFSSSENCTYVKNHWSSAASHAAWPESIDYPIYANNSCLPPGATGYTKEKGCGIGGLPEYIVNATTEEQIATAMAWASKRGIRIVVKGTGHDLNGRSTGAYALSIWTHNFKHFEHHPAWQLPGKNNTTDVVVCGSGNTWGSVYTAVHKINRTLVGGEDATVGLGGLIQNGGHGLLSSHYGLASDQVYQVTVITTDGRRLVANAEQNQDLFWAVRGGGGGQYGVVTEFVLKTHPVPASVVTGGLSFYPSGSKSESISWIALAEIAAHIPDIMDGGLTGTVMAFTGEKMMSYMGLDHSIPGVAASLSFVGFNLTIDHMNATIHRLAAQITTSKSLNITIQPPSTQSYWSYTKPNPLASNSAGSLSLFSSRLLGKPELSNITQKDLITYLQQIQTSQDTTAGTMLLFGLQAGPGPAGVTEEMRGSVNPAWRSAYAHVMVYGGASVNATGNPSSILQTTAEWLESAPETIWRNWAPNTGAYMNEGNPFSSTWKRDFYGEYYDQLLGVKQKYDPSESLFVWSGVGSDMWEYDLNSGLLCLRV